MTLATPPLGEPFARFEFVMTDAEFAEYQRAARRHLRRFEPPGVRWLAVLAAAVAALGGAAAGYVLEPSPAARVLSSQSALIGALVAILVGWVLLLAIGPFRQRLVARHIPREFQARRIALYANGLASDTAYTESFFPWGQVTLVEFCERLAVFWLGPQGGIPLPASAAGGGDRLREVWREARDRWLAARDAEGTRV